MKVYILTESSGQYEDYYETVVGIYSTYEKAKIKKNAYIEWNETLKDKYLAEEEVYYYDDEDYWYDIKGYELE